METPTFGKTVKAALKELGWVTIWCLLGLSLAFARTPQLALTIANTAILLRLVIRRLPYTYPEETRPKFLLARKSLDELQTWAIVVTIVLYPVLSGVVTVLLQATWLALTDRLVLPPGSPTTQKTSDWKRRIIEIGCSNTAVTTTILCFTSIGVRDNRPEMLLLALEACIVVGVVATYAETWVLKVTTKTPSWVGLTVILAMFSVVLSIGHGVGWFLWNLGALACIYGIGIILHLHKLRKIQGLTRA